MRFFSVLILSLALAAEFASAAQFRKPAEAKKRYDPYPASDKWKKTDIVNRAGAETGRIVDRKHETRYRSDKAQSGDWGNEYDPDQPTTSYTGTIEGQKTPKYPKMKGVINPRNAASPKGYSLMAVFGAAAVLLLAH